jgi:hypothetical protein
MTDYPYMGVFLSKEDYQQWLIDTSVDYPEDEEQPEMAWYGEL